VDGDAALFSEGDRFFDLAPLEVFLAQRLSQLLLTHLLPVMTIPGPDFDRISPAEVRSHQESLMALWVSKECMS
jgi:hypothetical protein